MQKREETIKTMAHVPIRPRIFYNFLSTIIIFLISHHRNFCNQGLLITPPKFVLMKPLINLSIPIRMRWTPSPPTIDLITFSENYPRQRRKKEHNLMSDSRFHFHRPRGRKITTMSETLPSSSVRTTWLHYNQRRLTDIVECVTAMRK